MTFHFVQFFCARERARCTFLLPEAGLSTGEYCAQPVSNIYPVRLNVTSKQSVGRLSGGQFWVHTAVYGAVGRFI